MAKFMISFPSSAMVVPDDEWEAVGEAAHAVIRDAKAAGVYVFGGGINESVAPVTVDGEGVVTESTYPSTGDMFGGYTIIEVPTAAEAYEWAAKIAVACRCPQEVREFQYDPES
ncbi:YciI family protein [Microbacterium sp. F2]|uniref:YciI family protein n=1 Tax=Microbacterium sp. F2 TaxID=3422228 RepID=UPI003FCF9EEB